MSLPKEIEQLIATLPAESQEVVRAIALIYEAKIAKLEARIKELEDEQSKNSSNSSKPPSSDSPFKRSLKERQKRSLRKPGGQKGHGGSTLKMVSAPDHREIESLNQCSQCGTCLSEVAVSGYQSRQVFDLPEIKLEVREHQAEVKSCPCCSELVVADFPSHVNSSVQYGPNLKSLLSYWQNYQMLPYARTVEMVKDLTGHSLSAGTLYNTQHKVYTSLEGFESRLKELLAKQELAHFDETGAHVSGDLAWVHLCTTKTHAHFESHAKRGQEAMDEIGILPSFEGTMVHDFWKSYFSYGSKHGMCNAHLLRELKAMKDFYDQDWAEKMAKLLRRIKKSVDKAKESGKATLAKQVLSRFQNQYEKLLEQGFQINPPPIPTGKRGRPAKSKPRNLLERFQEWEDDILRFMHEFQVPFDNNLAERNLRMLKVKLKISGCFRSQNGIDYFMRIRSFIVTARLQGFSAFDALKQLFINPTQIQNRLLAEFEN